MSPGHFAPGLSARYHIHFANRQEPAFPAPRSAAAGPWVVIIEGDAGIGKTTLWEAALDLLVTVVASAGGPARCGGGSFSYIAGSRLLGTLIDETTRAGPGGVPPRSGGWKTAFLAGRRTCRRACSVGRVLGCCAPSRRLRSCGRDRRSAVAGCGVGAGAGVRPAPADDGAGGVVAASRPPGPGPVSAEPGSEPSAGGPCG